MTRRSWWWLAPLVVAQLVVACSSTSQTASTTASPTTAPTTSEPATTSTTTPTTSTVLPTTAVAPSTTAATTSSTVAPSLVTEARVIGKSVQGRDITAYRMGDPTGRPVLLIGVIHGNEAKGFGITQLIRTMPTPPGIDLWIIDSINPDGQAANTRQNANGVDLNRNVSWNWNYIPKSEDNGQYSGEAPADQPETQALESFVTEIQPKVTIFWHQDANRVSPGGARRVIPNTFASIVGLTTASTPCTAGCTGTATQYVNHAVNGGTAFIVELPGDDAVTPEMIALHAEAALDVITL
ncbi:MAG TPA: M14 family zinc carboxypeptidase [Ilumatobacteraceae bacterium]